VSIPTLSALKTTLVRKAVFDRSVGRSNRNSERGGGVKRKPRIRLYSVVQVSSTQELRHVLIGW